MTAMTLSAPSSEPIITRGRVAQVILGIALIMIAAKIVLPEGLIRPPEWLVLPLADWVNAAFAFLRDDLGLIHVTRAFSDMIQWLLDVTANLLYGKNRWPNIGPIPWVVITVTAGFVGYALNGWRLAALAGGTFLWIAVMGQWTWSMETLSVIIVAAPFSVFAGLLIGIAAWRSSLIEKILHPVMNIAQSMPHFAYMIPVVVFIGVGPKAGAVVTIIFSMPPMIRMTLLGLKKVPDVVIESGQMCGASNRQMLWKVRIPTARTEIMIGVNQVIMQCLAMVVLAAFIGMPGLGQKLLQLLQALKIGRSFEIGITIVLLAIMLDRCSIAWATRAPAYVPRGTSWLRRHRLLVLWAVVTLVLLGLGRAFPLLDQLDRQHTLSIAGPLDQAVGWFVGVANPVTEWLRWFLITQILMPLRSVFLYAPFSAVLLLVAAAGWAVGGLRAALACICFLGFIAISGWWDRAMITAYTVVVSVTLAAMVGFPLALWGSRNSGRAAKVLLLCDSLQTFPSFIYLIPVVMLFGVNDVAVVGAVVMFAAVPLVRYTIEGLRNVPAEMIEASSMSGASYRQTMWHVRLPIALPTIVVGINQSVMFSLIMVIIAAFIGTQDLGQELMRALSVSDVGKGLVIGTAVAFMGLMVDYILQRWAERRRVLLGL